MQVPSFPAVPAVGGKESPRRKILIVDDIEENLDLLEDVLSEHKYQIVRARNGMEGLDVLLSTPVDLVIADAMMPRMDGFEFCKAVRKLDSHHNTPFVIHSANYVDREDEEFAHNLWVDRYVVKDPGLGMLLGAVDELLSQHPLQESRRRSGHDQQVGSSRLRIDEPTFLERHHSMVSKKLEEKMQELELYAETLNKRNRELQASEARYRSLFEYVGVGIFVIDRRTGKVLDVNRKGTVLLRSTREQILAMESFPWAEMNQFLSGLLQTEEYASAESAIRTSDGEVIDVEVGVGPVAQPHDKRLILFLRDITGQRRIRQQLMQAEKMMMMGCFATGIAHEIRNPLTAVTLSLQVLQQKHGNNGMRDYIEAATEATQRIGSVVENTLNLARQAPLVLKPEQVNPIVETALRFVRISLREKNLQTELRLAESLPLIDMDVREVQQALLNLLQNAIEATVKGGTITVTTALQSLNDDTEEKVVIAVKDAGPGIESEDLAHVFEPLLSRESGGMGIGLALSKHIMDRHHGEISLEPHPDGGTVARLAFKTDKQNNGGINVQR